MSSKIVLSDKQTITANERFWQVAVEQGFDIPKMAVALKISYSYVNQIKNGYLAVNKSVATKIRNALGYSENWVLYGIQPKIIKDKTQISPDLVNTGTLDTHEILKLYLELSARLKKLENRAARRFGLNIQGYEPNKINIDEPSNAELISLLNILIQREFKLESLIEIEVRKSDKKA